MTKYNSLPPLQSFLVKSGLSATLILQLILYKVIIPAGENMHGGNAYLTVFQSRGYGLYWFIRFNISSNNRARMKHQQKYNEW